LSFLFFLILFHFLRIRARLLLVFGVLGVRTLAASASILSSSSPPSSSFFSSFFSSSPSLPIFSSTFASSPSTSSSIWGLAGRVVKVMFVSTGRADLSRLLFKFASTPEKGTKGGVLIA